MNAQQPTDHGPIANHTWRRSPTLLATTNPIGQLTVCGPPCNTPSADCRCPVRLARIAVPDERGRNSRMVLFVAEHTFGGGPPLYLRSWGFTVRCRRQERLRLRAPMCNPHLRSHVGRADFLPGPICTSAGRSRQTRPISTPLANLAGSTKAAGWNLACCPRLPGHWLINQREQHVSGNTRVVRPP